MKRLLLLFFVLIIPFTLFAQNADYGDAPDNAAWWGGTAVFPTLNGSTGPKHIQGDQSTFWIGDMSTKGANTTTMESDANVINNDADDGRPFIFIVLVGIPAPSAITVPITTSALHNPGTDIYVNVAIDVDNDLDFNDSPDLNWVVQNHVVNCPADTTLGFDFGPFGFGSDLVLLPVWVRVTLTTEPITPPWNGMGKIGGWTNGETEDWWFGANGARGSRSRAGAGAPPPGGGGAGAPPGGPPGAGGGGGGAGKCAKLSFPSPVYLKCEETKCFPVYVHDCGTTPLQNVNISFSFLDGTPLGAGPTVQNTQQNGNVTKFTVCVTGWPCEGEDRYANYKIKVTYDPDGMYVIKEYELKFGNDEFPLQLDDGGIPVNRVNGEPLDSNHYAPWEIDVGESISKLFVSWVGEYPGGGQWLANGQPQLIATELPAWASFNETDRADDNNSATYTLSGTPGALDYGLHYLVLEVSSDDPTDGFAPWDMEIPIYINAVNHTPEITTAFDIDYFINTAENESMTETIMATDDDHQLSKRDTIFFDWYLWDTDSLGFYDPGSVTFTPALNQATFNWMPTRDDVGNYTLVAQAFDYYYALDTLSTEVSVIYMNPDFVADRVVGFAPLEVQFTDMSITENTEISAYEWDFYDGDFNSNQNPSHTYNESGTYSVHLQIDNGTHQMDLYRDFMVVVNEVDFVADTSNGEVPLEVQFTNMTGTDIPTSISSTTATSVEFSWIWDFGDDVTSGLKNPIHTYDQPGIYDVSLTGIIYVYDHTVSDSIPVDTIVSEIFTRTNYITANGDLLADFDADTTDGYAPLTVQFTDKSTGEPSGWAWTFGDGTESFDQNPEHTYEEPGLYSVSLTVSRDGSQSNTKPKSNYINVKQMIKAEFSADPTEGDSPLDVKFTDESIGDPIPSAWTWDFGDGATSNFQSPDHLYQSEGVYNVTLIVENGLFNDTLTKAAFITVTSGSDTTLKAKFSAEPLNGEAPLIVQFTDMSTGNPDSWSWDFGDGNISEEQNPQNTYENSGTYTVSLEISDGSSTVSASKENYIMVGVTGVYDFMANSFELYDNYPNPFKDITEIKYDLEYNSLVSLRIYNILGEEILMPVTGKHQGPGVYRLHWNGRDAAGKLMPAGVYYYELMIEGSEYKFSKTKEMIIIR